MKDAQTPAATGEEGLFSHLVASKPPKERKANTAAATVSIAFHGIAVAGLVWATLALGNRVEDEPEEQITLFQIEEEPPPPPPPPPPPEEPPPPPPPEMTEVAQGFQTLAPPDFIMPEIPPPSLGPMIREMDFLGEGIEGGRGDGTDTTATTASLANAPAFTPYTVAPSAKNLDQVRRALRNNYPPLLRDAGIGGRVVVWFFIDETGEVQNTQLKESSGYADMDEAAMKVAEVFEFRPALNQGRPVPVWVEIPITFQVN